ncbi:response regulator transcription factor [uncultured Sphingomonas sp.]|uniref:response regulator transcription factor n=1 Tax=uncultured Sphingomonas sp. TaxID=158754 RepID=UPI0035C9BF89
MARILIIDDDEILAEIVVDALASAGHLVSAVHHGHQAIRAVDESGPELIILDYDLPGVTGLEILRQIRRRPYGPGLPVLMLTATTSRLLPARAHRDDIDDYLVKPVALDLLVGRVEALLRSAALSKQVSHTTP